MYEEEKIFGPLTFKQMVFLAGGTALFYVVKDLFEPSFVMVLWVLIAVVVILLVYRYRPNKIELDDLDVYLEQKRLAVGDALYLKWVRQKVAELKSQQKI